MKYIENEIKEVKQIPHHPYNKYKMYTKKLDIGKPSQKMRTMPCFFILKYEMHIQ